MLWIILIFITAIIVGVLASILLYTERATKYHHLGKKFGLHFHHSNYGIVAFLTVPFVASATLIAFLVGFGIGIIADHTAREGFIFVTRDRLKPNYSSSKLHESRN